MSTQIYVNLPVKNLASSVGFFTRLGFEFNPHFTNEQAACVLLAEDIHVMLLQEELFQTFTPLAMCDARKSTEMLLCLTRESRKEVDDLVRLAVAAGATTPMAPRSQDGMYQHGFQDLDGHLWEILYMEPAIVKIGPEDS